MTNHLISGETDLSLDELANEFKIIQSGEKRISIIGTRNLSIIHQQIVETLSCALVQAGNTIITSGGASGVNFAAIEGALKGDPSKLEVILPQTIKEQPLEVQDKLKEVRLVTEHTDRVDMDFSEASRICYNEIVDAAHQLICFLYHDSNTLAKAVEYAKFNHKIVTVFYLD
ncbi:MAG: DNA-processing protein DprA [Candidatus Caenarcaniphilales bacterium]|nr:DNA-processing protein DprA [Candidatus Caenarcaniphilales bacterium]